ncbi:MAG: hypothetical protein R3F48_04785 [Candidatus Zixiibacteriota bacterium]
MNAATETGRPQTTPINRLKTYRDFFRYNAGNVFAGKFIYFILFAVAVFLTVIVIYTLENSTPPDAESVYYFLLVPGILLIFYPSTYAIDSEVNSRMIETIFGIPDYRYKVFLARNIIQYVVVISLLLVLALFCRIALADFSILPMLFQVMFPIVLIGSCSFMVATLTRSGNGTAAIMIIIILFFFFFQELMYESRWNLFLNPFRQVQEFELIVWQETTLYNRIYIAIGAILTLMFGLLRMQKREKFV